MKRTFEILKENSGKRLDNVLALFTNKSRSIVQKLIEDGNVKINNQIVNKSSSTVKEGIIEISFPEPKILELKSENLPLEIIYQDKDIIIINKEAGLSVHPSHTSNESTLVNALLYHIKDLSNIGGVIRPGIVHRLDKDTSGILIVAKTNEAHSILSEDFKNRKIEKKYLAIVKGIFRIKQGEIRTLIGRDKKDRKKMSIKVEEGREAYSKYKVLEESDKFSLVEVEIKTGRTHQIRVHLSALGHPILGDELYGKKESYPRQMLHAYSLAFSHPINKKYLHFKTPLPKDFINILKELSFTYFKEEINE